MIDDLSMAADAKQIAAILQALQSHPAIIAALVGEVPSANLKRRPKPGKWSAHEHAVHLAEAEAMLHKRLDYMLSTPDPVITPYDPAKAHDDDALRKMDLDEALDRYARLRAAKVERLRKLTPDQWAITAEHPEYSRYSVFIMVRHIMLHDFLHGYRIEECLLNREWK